MEPDAAPAGFTVSRADLEAMVAEAAKRLVESGGIDTAGASAATTEESLWWDDVHGPTALARDVFASEDAWLLAWQLHRQSGRPLVAVQRREAGSRQQVWTPVHPLLSLGPGKYLDVEGVHAEPDVLLRWRTGRSAKNRIVPMPPESNFARYLAFVSGQGAPDSFQQSARWEDVSTRSTEHVGRLLARKLLDWFGVARSS